MAQRILSGDLFAFYAGQTYLGSFEQYLQAGLLALVPDTPTALRMVPLVLAIATAAVVTLLGTRVTGSRLLGVLAGALFALGPYYSVVKGVRSHGAYSTAALMAALVPLAALAIDRGAPRPRLRAAALGLACGFAVWESSLIVYVLVPAALWAIGSARGDIRRLLPPALAGAVVGALPLIVHRAIHGPFVGSGRPPQPPTDYWQRLDDLVQPVSGMFLGVRELGAGQAVLTWLPPALVTLAAVAAIGAALWQRRRGIVALVTLRREGRHPVDLLLVGFAIAPVLYAASDFTWFTGEPRYLFTLYPALAVLAAALAGAIRWRPAAIGAGAALVAVVAALTTTQLVRAIDADGYPPIQAGGFVYTEDMPTVADALAAMGVKDVYADYWVAYPLQFAAGDRLAVSAFADKRFPELEEEVADSRRPPAYVTPLGDGERAVAQGLRASGARFHVRRVARFAVFSDIAPRRDPAQIGQPR
jgi:hypothetical protein